jgi:hypothetical protein
MSRDVHSCTHLAETLQPLASPSICAHIRGALLVSQDRRHILVTPWTKRAGTNCSTSAASLRWPMASLLLALRSYSL